MVRHFIILFATLIFLVGCAWIWVVKEPMSFLSDNYPMWRAKMDMATHLPPGSVVILGDSRPQVGLIPDLLGPDVYNLAVSGASPIEVLAYARLTLSGPNPPRAVILSLGPFRCITDGCFWEFAVKFGLLDRATLEEIRARTRQYPGENSLATTDRLDPAVRTPLFGPKTIGDIEARLKLNLYSARFPSYYFGALEESRFDQAEAPNRQVYREVIETRGHKLIWLENGSRGLSAETTASAFVRSPLMDSYFVEMLDLFQKRNIPVYFIGCPLNEESIAALQPGFADAFDAYIKSYEKSHPNFHTLGPTLPSLPWINFGEAGHLNANGAKVFSADIAARLRAAGIEK